MQTSEEFFGLLSFDPGEKPVCIVDGDASDWEGEQPLLASKDTELYVKSDEAYIYLMLRGKNDDIRITADTAYPPAHPDCKISSSIDTIASPCCCSFKPP